ncbi:hypothetical protein HMPREF1550_00765 [Actinomyces sp. oral taxon 877 str. F0543]|nr:hypothetical protein HMPREF1550_00765 [Actinomyces sp. oral taxon 877 str. F0543]
MGSHGRSNDRGGWGMMCGGRPRTAVPDFTNDIGYSLPLQAVYRTA